MTIPERYQHPDSWPHGFTNKGRDYVGEDGKMNRDMVCKFCYLEYTWGKEAKPIGVCPARKDKQEYKRIING